MTEDGVTRDQPSADKARLDRIAYEVVASHAQEVWTTRVEAMLRAFSEGLECSGAGLYVLHLDTAHLTLDYAVDDVQDLPEAVAASASRDERDLHPAALAAATGEVQHSPSRATFVPLQRGQTCLYVLALLGPAKFDSWPAFKKLLEPLRPAYVARRVSRLVENTRPRLDFRSSWRDFMAGLGDMVLTSSGFKYAVLREKRGNRLDCIAAWGFSPTPAFADLSWAVDRYDPFFLAANGHATPVVDLRASNASELSKINGLEVVRGFVAIPVYVGNHTFGVLSLATEVPYEIVPAELSAFETLGNMIGVVIAHYRNPQGPSPSLDSLSDFSMRTSLEVIAASARHEGMIDIANAIDTLGKLDYSKGKKHLDSNVDHLEECLLDLAIVIDKIRAAAKPPEYNWAVSSVRDIWKAAIGQFGGRLDTLDIDVRMPQNDVRIGCYPDWIHSVFLQLILNSIDAFSKKGFGLRPPSKTNRAIGLVIDPPAKGQRVVTMRYWDNATGINASRLDSRAEDADLPLERRLFKPGASTKRQEGSGWGLALARAAMADHHGSIELLENSVSGVTFQLELPNTDA